MDQTEYGQPPRTGWAKLVPELYVSDFDVSLEHWCRAFGFSIAYQRPAERFAYLERPEGCQIMLCQWDADWNGAPIERPCGRGVLLQVFVDDVGKITQAIEAQGGSIQSGPREVWRRWGDREGGKREIFAQDPDGFLVLFAQDIGERPLPPNA